MPPRLSEVFAAALEEDEDEVISADTSFLKDIAAQVPTHRRLDTSAQQPHLAEARPPEVPPQETQPLEDHPQEARPHKANHDAGPEEPPSLSAAKSSAQACSWSLGASWNELQNILKRHEEEIRKRWSKKSNKRRRLLLMEVWPAIPHHHRPDWEAMVCVAKARGLEGPVLEVGKEFRDAFLMPYINLEDLSSGINLLVFLHTRANNIPETFAMHDYQYAALGFETKSIDRAPIEVEGAYHMAVPREPIAEQSGSSSFEKSTAKSMGSCHVNLDISLIILEIQDRVLAFLVKCVKSILYDIEEDQLLSGSYPFLESLDPLPRGTRFEKVTIDSLAEDGPYQVPRPLQFDQLNGLIESRRRECEDYIWALREDPGFFRETVMSCAEHRQECVPDIFGSDHPFKNTPKFWDRVITDMIQQAYTSLITWILAQKLLNPIEKFYYNNGELRGNGQSLPEELELGLLTFVSFLKMIQTTWLSFLNAAVPSSPELRTDFIRDTTFPDPNVCYLRAKNSILDDHLLLNFTILADDRRVALMGLHELLNDTERTIRRDPKQKMRISSLVAQTFSELALSVEIERQINLYEPQLFGPFGQTNLRFTLDTVKETAFKTISSDWIILQLMEDLLGVADEGTPFASKFDYPSDKQRTKQVINQMRLAESNLDKLWEKVDKIVLTRGRRKYTKGKTLHELSISLNNLTSRALRRTEPWVELRKPPKDPRSGHSDTQEIDNAVRFKVELPPLNMVFPVDKRAFKVFQALFHSPLNPDRPGDVPWVDFLYAISKVGYSYEKLYGTAWYITPSEEGQSHRLRPMMLHDPHPLKKMPYCMTRRYGDRFKLASGFTAENFSLE